MKKIHFLVIALLLSMFTLSAFGMSAAITADGTYGAMQWAGGSGVLSANGTFGGGSLAVECCQTNSATSSDWIPVGSGSNLCILTAPGTAGFSVPAHWYIRIHLTGSTSPSIVQSMDGVFGRAASD